jgi:amino acid transporter
MNESDRPLRTDPGGLPDGDAAAELSKLGYAQELLRAMGGFSSFALSFSVISVLTGIITTYDVAITGGGPAALGIGWPIVSVGTLFVAMAMGELASAFPTAGAMYHWASVLGGKGWGWFVAMMNLLGKVAIVAAIDLGCAQQLVAALGWPAGRALLVFVAIILGHGMVNLVSVRVVAWLNDFSATVHIVGVAVLVALLVVIGRAHPFAFALQTGFTTRPDGNYALGFLESLLLGMWTFTGFDASAHVSEETHDPGRRAPWGIVLSVLVSAIAGYALVLAITLAISDLHATAADPHPALFVLQGALGAGWGSTSLGIAIVAMWFCGLSSITSLSRTLYAFARDGGIPYSHQIRAVSARAQTPHVAITVATVLCLVVGLVSSVLRQDQFLAVASLATTALYVSYGIPIALGAVARHRPGGWGSVGAWRLGRAGAFVAWGAVAWSLFVLGVAGLPYHGAFLGLLGAFGVLFGVLYVTYVRHHYAGPLHQPH